jgi:ketosteroid isomerase-like protein
MRFECWMAGVMLVLSGTMGAAADPGDRESLLRTREAVWRAWFEGDTPTLEKILPDDTIVISSGEAEWKHRAEVLRGATEFHASGGQLIRLEFPQTEIQRLGDVAIVYSRYSLEFEVAGKRSSQAGRVTEIFVLRNGLWSNTGWHTDSEAK